MRVTRSLIVTANLVLASALPALAQESVTAPTAATEAAPASAVTQTETTTQPAAQEPAKKEAAVESKTTISGKLYGDMTHRSNLDTGYTNTIKRHANGGNGTGVDIKRFYFGVSHKIDKVWSATFLSDIGDQNGKYDVFVKKAYIEAKPASEAVFRLGSADLPWVPYVENLYGYRYVENIMIDRTKFGTSADWGLHFSGAAAGGWVNYAASAVNGSGYANPTRPRSQDPDFEGRFGLEPIKGLNIAVGGYRGKLGSAVPTKNIAQRVDGVVAYVSSRFRLGGEYFKAANWKNLTKAGNDHSSGFSGWGSVVVTEPIAIFARFDQVKPSMDYNKNLKDQYALGGVEYKVNKAVNLALAYKNEVVSSGDKKGKGETVSTSNGKIGSSVAKKEGRSNEFGLWAQYAF